MLLPSMPKTLFSILKGFLRILTADRPTIGTEASDGQVSVFQTIFA